MLQFFVQRNTNVTLFVCRQIGARTFPAKTNRSVTNQSACVILRIQSGAFIVLGTTRFLPSHQAFLFSIHGPNGQHSMPIKPSSFEKAAKAGVMGLQFGEGPDLIFNEDLKSGQSNLGKSFALPAGYQRDTVRAKNVLAGMGNFSVDELEMFYAFGKLLESL